MTDPKVPLLKRLDEWSKSPPSGPKPRGDKGKAWYDRLLDWADRQPVAFGGLSMKAGRLSYKEKSQPIAGVWVTVESAGELQKRATLTRAIAGGLVFGPAGAVVGSLFQKTVDTRELYMAVEGDQASWVVPVSPSKGAAARTFAAKVNTAARR